MRCAITDCLSARRYSDGLCPKHHQRLKRTGTTEWVSRCRECTPIERFMSKVSVLENDCWQWTGGSHSSGYAYFMVNGKNWRAHRWSFEFHIGKIPKGRQLDHLCRNRRCVNPFHLEPVTARENSRRKPKKATCIHGHLMTPENTYRHNKKRSCKECRRLAIARLRAARRLALETLRSE